MAIRKLRTIPDDILRKKCRVVEKIDDKILELLDDMVETMVEEDGVGLAAPQVGILKRLVVIDVGEGVFKMINPEILEMKGAEVDIEGCLSVPERSGEVERPTWLKLRYTDIEGREILLEAEDFFARAICHELDHLDGVLYIDKLVSNRS